MYIYIYIERERERDRQGMQVAWLRGCLPALAPARLACPATRPSHPPACPLDLLPQACGRSRFPRVSRAEIAHGPARTEKAPVPTMYDLSNSEVSCTPCLRHGSTRSPPSPNQAKQRFSTGPMPLTPLCQITTTR